MRRHSCCDRLRRNRASTLFHCIFYLHCCLLCCFPQEILIPIHVQLLACYDKWSHQNKPSNRPIRPQVPENSREQRPGKKSLSTQGGRFFFAYLCVPHHHVFNPPPIQRLICRAPSTCEMLVLVTLGWGRDSNPASPMQGGIKSHLMVSPQ